MGEVVDGGSLVIYGSALNFSRFFCHLVKAKLGEPRLILSEERERVGNIAMTWGYLNDGRSQTGTI